MFAILVYYVAASTCNSWLALCDLQLDRGQPLSIKTRFVLEELILGTLFTMSLANDKDGLSAISIGVSPSTFCARYGMFEAEH